MLTPGLKESVLLLVTLGAGTGDSSVGDPLARPGPQRVRAEEMQRDPLLGGTGPLRLHGFRPVDTESAPLVLLAVDHDVPPSDYDGVLRHLATWGYAAFAAGRGPEQSWDRYARDLAGLLELHREGSLRLDPGPVALIGHGSGAGAAVRVVASRKDVAALILVAPPAGRMPALGWLGHWRGAFACIDTRGDDAAVRPGLQALRTVSSSRRFRLELDLAPPGRRLLLPLETHEAGVEAEARLVVRAWTLRFLDAFLRRRRDAERAFVPRARSQPLLFRIDTADP